MELIITSRKMILRLFVLSFVWIVWAGFPSSWSVEWANQRDWVEV